MSGKAGDDGDCKARWGGLSQSASGSAHRSGLAVVNCTGDTFTQDKSGAIATWVHQLCMAAARDGISPVVVSRSSSGRQLNWQPVSYVDYPPMHRGRVYRRCAREIVGLRGYQHERQPIYNTRVREALASLPSLTHVVFHNDIELAVLVKRWFPQIVVAHIFHSRIGVAHRFARKTASIDVHLAVSSHTASWADSLLGQRPGTTGVIYGGVDLSSFPVGSPATSPPVINFIGLINERKAPDILLAAAELLVADQLQFSLQIIGGTLYGANGSDAYVAALRQSAEALERRGVPVAWRGYLGRAEVPAALRAAAINVVPTRGDEAFGLVVLEGMASGCATVVARVGGLPEAVGEAGYLFDRDDVQGLSETLRRLLTDADLLRDRQRAARARAETFTWDATWLRLQSLMPDVRTTGSAD